MPVSRRDFLSYSSSFLTLTASGLTPNFKQLSNMQKPIRIKNVNANFERELLYPYRFKGSEIRECWQIAALLQSDSGITRVGLGTQSVLWSDSTVFANHSVSGGNSLMFAMTEKALQLLKGTSFTDPVELLDRLFPEVYEYGKKITGNDKLRKTFALNALVPVDNAAWMLYAAENGFRNFDEMIPASYKPGLSYRNKEVASMPSFSVGADVKKIKAAADQGYFIMKLKTGSSGTQQEMLAKDIEFLTAVHKAIGHYETPYTRNGKVPYYFDANERYDEKDTLHRFLDHAKKIGAFDQIAVVEEPFGERNSSDVREFGVTIAADESAHTVEDAGERIEQGYSAMAVKAVAKTLSMTMKITQLAHERKVPCFCADLTVNPVLVDWNKSVAARLAPFPGLSLGLIETNGHQYYKEWPKLISYHPISNGSWVQTRKGVYVTDNSFYKESGGILKNSQHYLDLFKEGE